MCTTCLDLRIPSNESRFVKLLYLSADACRFCALIRDVVADLKSNHFRTATPPSEGDSESIKAGSTGVVDEEYSVGDEINYVILSRGISMQKPLILSFDFYGPELE